MSKDILSESSDKFFINEAIEVALESEKRGNLPVGAVIVMDGAIIARGYNSVRLPVYHPGRHAEMEALKSVPEHFWPESRQNDLLYDT